MEEEGSGYVGLSCTLESVRNVIATRSGHVDMSVNGSRFVTHMYSPVRRHIRMPAGCGVMPHGGLCYRSSSSYSP